VKMCVKYNVLEADYSILVALIGMEKEDYNMVTPRNSFDPS
jgi:hypothetical protein